MLSTPLTRAALRIRVRRELRDAHEHIVTPKYWWTDTELNEYLNDWMQNLNTHFNILNTATTISVGTNTNTITTPSTMLRVAETWWNNTRLLPTTLLRMDTQHPFWREHTMQPQAKPLQVIELDQTRHQLYPTPGQSGVVTIVGPRKLEFTNDSSVCPLPPWMYYSARLYCAAMAYLRAGPNQDLRKASRYKARYDRMIKFYRLMLDGRFASYGVQLKPATNYEGSILTGRER